MTKDIDQRAARHRQRRPAGLPARTSGRRSKEVDRHRRTPSSTREMFRERYGDVFKGPAQWQAIRVDADSDTYRWNDGSTYVQNPPYFEGMTHGAAAGRRHQRRARAGACSATPSPPTTSRPAGNIRKTSPAGDYLLEHQVPPGRLQQLRRPPRQPRGHDARHLRQHPHQERDGARRRRRRHQAPARRARSMPIYDAAMRYKARGHAAGGRSAARNTAPARRATGRPRAPSCSASRR